MSISSLLATDGQTAQKKTLVVGGVVLLFVVSIAAVSFAFSGYLKTTTLVSSNNPTTTALPARGVAAVKTPVVNIAYYDAKNYDLKFASNFGGDWAISRVDAMGRVGQDTSLAVDSKGKMHIAYYDDSPNYDLKYATNASGAWVTTTLDAVGNVGWYPSLVLDVNDKVYIAYADNSNKDLKFATNANGSWVKTIIDRGTSLSDIPGRYVSMVLDSNGKAHVGYQYLSGGSRGYLKYATNANGVWTTTFIDGQAGAGFGVSAKIDALGKIHMSYYSSTLPKYITNISGSWVSAIVEPKMTTGNGTLGFNTSLVLDSNNRPIVCYPSGTTLSNFVLKCASKVANKWSVFTSFATPKQGMFNSLGIDDKNSLYLSYYDSAKRTLELASNATGTWVVKTIDNDSPVGTWTSLAISYNYVIPPTPPLPYGPYVPPTPPLPYNPYTPPLPYQPYVGERVVPTPEPPTPTPAEPKITLECPPPYVDVNGDGILSPADVLQVNAYLNGNRVAVPTTGATWQNQVNPVDVDGNGAITPSDSFAVVNAVNNGIGKIAEKSCVSAPYAAR